MRKQTLMRMAAMAAAGMVLMTGCGGNGSQAATTAATAAPETTQSSETTAPETTEAETTALEEAGETDVPLAPEGALAIAKQGMFSSGGTVTEPVEGESMMRPRTGWIPPGQGIPPM